MVNPQHIHRRAIQVGRRQDGVMPFAVRRMLDQDHGAQPAWEICLLDQVRQALKGGNLHVLHSRAFQPLEQYLIGRQEWEREKAALTQDYQLPLDFQTHWAKVTALHKEQLRELDDSFPSNDALRIEGDQFHLARPEQLVVSPTAKDLKEQIRKRLNRRQLSDLLLETHAWTGFLKVFTRLTSGRPITDANASDQVVLLACLISEGCNIGLRDMAVNNPGLNFDLMDEVKASYVREETLAKATATLVNFQLLSVAENRESHSQGIRSRKHPGQRPSSSSARRRQPSTTGAPGDPSAHCAACPASHDRRTGRAVIQLVPLAP